MRVVYKRLFSPAVYVWASYGILPEHLLNAAALGREMDRRGITGEAREHFGLREAEFSRAARSAAGRSASSRWESDDLIQLAALRRLLRGAGAVPRLHDAHHPGPR